jgi:hypothetical protein
MLRARLHPLLLVLLFWTTNACAWEWKVVLFTGDDSADVFDNARDAVGKRLFLMGVLPRHLIDLSYAQTDLDGNPWPASLDNLEAALRQLHVGPGDACLVHLTSHGARDGFLIGDDETLTPETLSTMLDESCGNQPTVVLISACYSGLFVDPVMQRPNRIVLTAARRDRTSFGCDAESEYTFWDGCLLDHLSAGKPWTQLYDEVTACIRDKEAIERERPSFPQIFVGKAVRDLRAPRPAPFHELDPVALFDALWGEPNACFLPAPELPVAEIAACW